MTILAEGRAHSAISVLHAVGLGQGCSIGIGLEIVVRLTDGNSITSNDHHSLLEWVVIEWNKAALPLPEKIAWQIDSEIPIGRGLKSSSALACAALRALNKATMAGLSDAAIIDLAVSAQRSAACTITGSLDDTWAAMESGWKLVDPSLPANESVLLQGEIEKGYSVLILPRGSREVLDFSVFSEHSALFERALSLLSQGSIFASLSANGMAVASALGDDESMRICNSAIAAGALAAGISGSGPAIAVVVFEEDAELMKSHLSEFDEKIIHTHFLTDKLEEVI